MLDDREIEYEEFDCSTSDRFALNYVDTCGDYLTHIIIHGNCISVEHCYLTPNEAIDLALNFWE